MKRSHTPDLDAIDRRLIDVLKSNARITNRTMATLLDLSPSASLARLRKLEERRIILGYTVLLAGEVSSPDRPHLVDVALETPNPLQHRKFESLICADPDVLSAVRVAGRYDYLLRMSSSSVGGWNRLANASVAIGVIIREARVTSIVEDVKGVVGV